MRVRAWPTPLYQLWIDQNPETPEGSEWQLVDAFAEVLGIECWYGWREDDG